REKDYRMVQEAEARCKETIEHLEKTRPKIEETNKILSEHGLPLTTDKPSLADLMRRPQLDIEDIKGLDETLKELSDVVRERVQIEIKYEGYINRTLGEVKRFQRIEKVKIPEGLVFGQVPGLSNEVIEKLDLIRPSTLGQASRISGITPVALLALYRYLKQGDSDEQESDD
ncbi:MAG: tRNA uridine-5-carboxymethylaminomethyl(34) synthesis enzyme MnmG, partial [candidate division WOR-3 bacterium]|nr:tRNA uridine-5-carboxymethylaminomethyl(34) synthesis enzyme MnmG [candidate division WOR-3 bacterium]